MSKLNEIYNGWKNYIFPNKEVEAIAKQRAKICAGCEQAVKMAFDELMPDNTLKEIEGLCCNICECPLSTKTRSLDTKCPKSKWFR
jgi:hypothetical protein